MPELHLDPEILDRFRRLAVALAIGLLIGIERGWKERADPEGSRTAGVRTFTLIGLMGGVLSLIAQQLGGLVLAAGFLAFALTMAGVELLHAQKTQTSDATSFVAELLTFALAALGALGYFHAAGAAAVTAAAILTFKEGLHRWIARVTFAELRAGLALAAMTMIVLPLLPGQPIDPWGAVSPRAVWLLTVLIAAISFAGYAAIRIAGPRRGAIVAGLAGGLVSSTAATVSFARMARERPEAASTLMGGAVVAGAVMLARVGVVASVLRADLLVPLAAALAPAAVASAAAAAWLVRRPHAPVAGQADGQAVSLGLKNPLELRAALMFGALLAAVSLAAAGLQTAFGAGGVYALAGLSGLADVDAITLSMTQAGALSSHVAAAAILIAVAVNTAAKAAMARLAGGPAAGRPMMVAAGAAIAAGAAGYVGYAVLAG